MSHINLLPWRAEQTKKKKNTFIVLLLLSSMAILAISYSGKVYVDSLLGVQNQRNQFLQAQTLIMDRHITELRQIKKEKTALEQRINLIQKLEEKRNDATRLFNILADTVPTGVYLKTVSFRNERVVVQGAAESNRRVTRMMRNVDRSGWLGDSHLRSIKEGPRKPIKLYNFVMSFIVLSDAKESKQ